MYPLEFAKLLGDEEKKTLQQMLVLMKEPLKEAEVESEEAAQNAMNDRRERTKRRLQEAVKSVVEAGQRRMNLEEDASTITSTIYA